MFDVRLSICLLAIIVFGLTGCSTQRASVLLNTDGQVWPAPPETTRIRYVGAFSSPLDFGIRSSIWSRISVSEIIPKSKVV